MCSVTGVVWFFSYPLAVRILMSFEVGRAKMGKFRDALQQAKGELAEQNRVEQEKRDMVECKVDRGVWWRVKWTEGYGGE